MVSMVGVIPVRASPRALSHLELDVRDDASTEEDITGR
jgi:hypothetical protein